MMIRK